MRATDHNGRFSNLGMLNPVAVTDHEVVTWASHLWPDVRETWWQYREYYRQEFARSHAQSAKRNADQC